MNIWGQTVAMMTKIPCPVSMESVGVDVSCLAI